MSRRLLTNEEGRPTVPAKWVNKTRDWVAGWRQLCGQAKAHYYEAGKAQPICGAKIRKIDDPERGVPVVACLNCLRMRGYEIP